MVYQPNCARLGFLWLKSSGYYVHSTFLPKLFLTKPHFTLNSAWYLYFLFVFAQGQHNSRWLDCGISMCSYTAVKGHAVNRSVFNREMIKQKVIEQYIEYDTMSVCMHLYLGKRRP